MLVKQGGEFGIELQGRFATGNNHMAGGEGLDGVEDILLGHLLTLLMYGVAKPAVQVATTEAYEYRRGTRVFSLPL